MTSRSEQPKRPWAAIAIRATRDKKLRETDRKVLIGLGYFANRAGVCWPSLKTLEAETGLTEKTIMTAIDLLVTAGYVRRLTPGMFKQRRGAWGFSNRYQLLWGGDEKVPTYEEVLQANLLQDPADQIPAEGSHAQGQWAENSTLTHKLLAAWASGYSQATGSPAPPVPVVWAQRMAAAGVKPAWFQAYVAETIGTAGRLNTQLPSFQTLAADAMASIQTANERMGSTTSEEG
jgi:hypothetical protein